MPINTWAPSKLNTEEKASIFILPLWELPEFLLVGWVHTVLRGKWIVICRVRLGELMEASTKRMSILTWEGEDRERRSLHEWGCLPKSEALTQKCALIKVNRICIHLEEKKESTAFKCREEALCSLHTPSLHHLPPILSPGGNGGFRHRGKLCHKKQSI